MIRLRGCQHPGRLVKDQHLGPAKQRFENFHSLLQPHRQILNHRLRVDIQLIIFFQALQDLAGIGLGSSQQSATLGAKDDVFQHGEIIDQHEMLMHHADASGNCVLGGGNGCRPAIDQNFTAIGLIIAVEDAHQGRFTGAIFADNAVDRAFIDGQVDIGVGAHRTKTLIDIYQLDRRRLGARFRVVNIRHSAPRHRTIEGF